MTDYKPKCDYIPNLTFTLEQHLTNYAEYEENARRLLESFHIIREKMEVNLRSIISLFPHYSEHSHEHSEHIISSIEKVLGKTRIEKLSPADTWMLLVCSYMHDLGMIVRGKEMENDWKAPEFREHINQCMSSHDEELKNAAMNVTSIESISDNTSWPVHIYRDVILIASEFYRRRHPERSRELPQRDDLKQALNVIMSSDGKLPPRIQDVIGKVCLSHGISFENMLNLLEPTDSLLGYVFHPRFTAAMLCLGDLCDLDNGRFNEMAIKVFGGLTRNNLIHYYKHESVTSFVILKDKISVIFDIPNKKIKNELKLKKNPHINTSDRELQDFCDEILLETQNWISWMDDIVQNIKTHWGEFEMVDIEAVSPTLNYKILIDGQSTISSKKNMRFSFSNEKAYELIESYSLYNNKLVFVRELLQNSIDALKRQFWNDIISGRWNHLLKDLEDDGKIDYSKIQPFDFSDNSVYDYYQVRIHVTHNEQDELANFVIEDNGTGISKEDVENRIIKTGMRDNLNNDIPADMPEWLKPTSAFGVGLHSVFAVTDTVFTQTRTETDKNVYNINMHSGKLDGYVFMSVAEKQDLRFCNCTHGTRMEFSINTSNCLENKEEDSYWSEDPYKDRPESNFCKNIQDILKAVLGPSLFTIKYKFNFDEYIFCEKICDNRFMKLIFNKKRRNFLLEKPYKRDDDNGYDFALDISGERIILWDRKKAILMMYSLFIMERNYCEVFCKNFIVNNIKMQNYEYNIIPDRIDYMGGSSKEILNVSRDKLSHKQIEDNKKIFSDARLYIAEVYYNLLKLVLNDSSVTEWHNVISDFMRPWLQEKKDDVRLPNLPDELSRIMCKYENILLNKDDLKIMILRHGFCSLLKANKDPIKNYINTFDDNERAKYVLDFKIIDDEENINIKNQTYLIDFYNAVIEIFHDKDEQLHITELLQRIFMAEFSDYYINYSEMFLNNLGCNYNFIHYSNCVFGDVYNTLSIGHSAYFFNRNRIQFKINLEKEAEGYTHKALDIYFSVPLMKILYLLICTGVDISSLKELIGLEIAYIPGYDNHYGFAGEINNILDIMLSSDLNIEVEKLSDVLVEYCPFMKWLPCESITVNANKKLILHFNNKYEKMNMVKFQGESFKKFLNSYSHFDKIPVLAEYEIIATKETSYNRVSSMDFREELLLFRNYSTYLWKEFADIKDIYGPRISSGENKENIIDEIMNSKEVINLLRYIYHNRAFKSDLPYDKEKQSIHDTYRQFVSMVLDCIPDDEETVASENNE